MKGKILNPLMLFAGLVLLFGCDPPEKNGLDNQIRYDGRSYKITDAGTDYEGAVWLYFESGDDAEAYFVLHVGEGEFGLTQSSTFTFAAKGSDNYGTPGTFSKGGFEDDATETEVISGTIVVEVSASACNVKIDCVCVGGKELTVRYSGPLQYAGPIGTTTFTVNGMTFPFAVAWIDSYGMDEDYGLYGTDIEIDAIDATGDREFECYLTFIHSKPSLAGTYDIIAEEPSAPGEFVFGGLYIGGYTEEGGPIEYLSGYLSEGRVKVGIAGDIYTITFDGIKLSTGTDLVEVTGAYTGSVIDDSRSGRASTKFISEKTVFSGHRLRK